MTQPIKRAGFGQPTAAQRAGGLGAGARGEANLPRSGAPAALPVTRRLQADVMDAPARPGAAECDFPPAAYPVSASASLAELDASAFPEGAVHQVRIGANNVGGTARLWREGAVFHLDLPLRFIGGICFGSATPAESAASGIADANPAFFKKGARSIAEIPALRQRVEDLCREIEAHFDAGFVKLHLHPEFVADETTAIDRSWVKSDDEIRAILRPTLGREPTEEEVRAGSMKFLSVGINQSMQKPASDGTMRIFLTPTPSRTVATPTLWDPFGRSELFGHELAHVLGVMNEGFLYNDYPLDGLMNCEYAFHALDEIAPGHTTKITRADFNEMMRSVSRTARPPVDRAQVSEEFPDLSSTYTQGGWEPFLTLNEEQRRAVMALRIEKWKAAHPAAF